MTRRQMLALLASSPAILHGQGMSRRTVAPSPRGKPSGRPFHAKFTDVAAAAGLRAPVIYGPPAHKQYLTETITAAASPFLILTTTAGSTSSCPEVRSSTVRCPAPGTGCTRTIATARSPTSLPNPAFAYTGWAVGVTVGDFDNDGFDDLFVTYWGSCALYRNNGDGSFTDVSAKAGIRLAATQWGSGCTFVDYNRDGLLDLVVAHYSNFDLKSVPKMGEASTCNWEVWCSFHAARADYAPPAGSSFIVITATALLAM